MSPLDRAHMTDAEKLTLPLYPAAFAALGLLLLGQNPARTSGPAFEPAKLLLSIPHWGVVFLVIAAVETLALVQLHRRIVYIWALRVGAGVAAFWAVLLTKAARDSMQVSYTSVVWVLVGVVTQMASARMLASRHRPLGGPVA